MPRQCIFLLLGSTLLASAAVAAPGDRIRVGAFELSPTVGLGSEYRSNVYRSEENGVAAANLDLATGLGIAAKGEEHQFDLDGRWELRKFYFVGPQQVGVPRSNGERIGNLDRFDTGNASMGVDTFRRSRLGFTLRDSFALRNATADAEYADVPYTTHLRNALTGDLRIAGSSALSFLPGGSWSYDDFRAPRLRQGSDRSINALHSYGPDLGMQWRFLPNTALVVDSEVRLNRWAENVLESNAEDEPEIEIPNSTFVKVRGGIDGQFTRKLFANLLLGYGTATYQGQSELAQRGVTGLTGLLVRFGVRYDLAPPTGDRPGSRIRAGYTRDFNDTFFSNYMALNAFELEYAGRFGRFEPTLSYSLRFERYDGELQRSDVVNRVGLDLRTPLRSWALLSVGGWWQQRASDMANVEFDDFHLRVSTAFTY